MGSGWEERRWEVGRGMRGGIVEGGAGWLGHPKAVK